MAGPIKEVDCTLRGPLDRTRVILKSVLYLVAGLLLLLSLINSLAPPRNADAMRYHLAQPKEMLRSGLLTFYPYFHYNFPRTFHLLFLPGEYFNWPALSGFLCWLAMLLACTAAIMTAKIYLKETRQETPHVWIVVLSIASFYLTPGIFYAASVPANDGALMCFFSWGYYLDIVRL